MALSYDAFTDAFLAKITEFDLLDMNQWDANEMINKYMKKAVVAFNKVCVYDLIAGQDDENGQYDVEIKEEDVDEIVDIVSEGMVVQWLKPYVYRQEVLENALSSRDWTVFSPANLLLRLTELYSKVQKDYKQMVRDYSYHHGDLTCLHI